jgi:hypothetical protein
VICGIASPFHKIFIWETRPKRQPASSLAEGRGKRRVSLTLLAPPPFKVRFVPNIKAYHREPKTVRDAKIRHR